MFLSILSDDFELFFVIFLLLKGNLLCLKFLFFDFELDFELFYETFLNLNYFSLELEISVLGLVFELFFEIFLVLKCFLLEFLFFFFDLDLELF